MNLGTINSSYLDPIGLIFNPNDITITCDSDWSFRGDNWPHVSGHGGVQITGKILPGIL